MACHMFESTDVQRHPAGTTFVLILRPDQMYEIDRLVSRMSREEIGSVFDPRRGGRAITVNVASTPARRVISVNLTERRDYKLPLPPKLLRANQRCGEEGAIKFSGLENLYISEDDRATEAQIEELRRYVGNLIKRRGYRVGV